MSRKKEIPRSKHRGEGASDNALSVHDLSQRDQDLLRRFFAPYLRGSLADTLAVIRDFYFEKLRELFDVNSATVHLEHGARRILATCD